MLECWRRLRGLAADTGNDGAGNVAEFYIAVLRCGSQDSEGAGLGTVFPGHYYPRAWSITVRDTSDERSCSIRAACEARRMASVSAPEAFSAKSAARCASAAPKADASRACKLRAPICRPPTSAAARGMTGCRERPPASRTPASAPCPRCSRCGPRGQPAGYDLPPTG